MPDSRRFLEYRQRAEEFREKYKTPWSIVWGVFLLVTAAGTLLFAAIGCHMLVREFGFQRNRAEAEGTITKTEVVAVSTRNRTRFKPEVTVAFTWNGERYETTQIRRFGSGPTGSQEWAAEELARYRVGDRVPAYFNARDPNDASLDPQTSPWMYVPLYAVCASAAFGGPVAAAAGFGRFWSTRAVAVVWVAVAATTTVHYLGVTGLRPASYVVFLAAILLVVGALVLWKLRGFARSPWDAPIAKWFLP
jgi:hypothetical protein